VFEIGSSLREARMRQSLDFNEMEARTKVRAKYLRALEAEQFDQLPAHTYVKGFLRTYADSLGMDGQLYVDEYNSRFVAGATPVLRARRVPQARGRRRGGSRASSSSRSPPSPCDRTRDRRVRFSGRRARCRRQRGARVAGRSARRRSQADGRRSRRSRRVVHGGACRLARRRQPLTVARSSVAVEAVRAEVTSLAAPANVEVKVNGTGVRVPADGELTVSSRSATGS
jgi:hypothetical protein